MDPQLGHGAAARRAQHAGDGRPDNSVRRYTRPVLRLDEAVRGRWRPCRDTVPVLGRLRGQRVLFHRVRALSMGAEDVVSQHPVAASRQP